MGWELPRVADPRSPAYKEANAPIPERRGGRVQPSEEESGEETVVGTSSRCPRASAPLGLMLGVELRWAEPCKPHVLLRPVALLSPPLGPLLGPLLRTPRRARPSVRSLPAGPHLRPGCHGEKLGWASAEGQAGTAGWATGRVSLTSRFLLEPARGALGRWQCRWFYRALTAPRIVSYKPLHNLR